MAFSLGLLTLPQYTFFLADVMNGRVADRGVILRFLVGNGLRLDCSCATRLTMERLSYTFLGVELGFLDGLFT